jgi:hypothetical protein
MMENRHVKTENLFSPRAFLYDCKRREQAKIAYGRVGRVHELSGQRAIIGQIYKFATYGIASDNIFFDFGSANANNRPAFDAALEKSKKVESIV